MRRREFIGILGGAAAAWPVGAWAQSSGVTRRVGALLGVSENNSDGNAFLEAFVQDLAGLGWIRGRNLQIEVRWSGGDANKVKTYATELIAFKPDLILVRGTVALSTMQKETRSIPIVAVQVIDLVLNGFAQSLAHPGGNITGFINFEPGIGGKWVLTLKEVVPNIERVAILLNPNNRSHGGLAEAVEIGAKSLSIQVTRLPVRTAEEVAQRISGLEGPNAGLIVLPDTVTISNLKLVTALAAKQRVSTVVPYREHVAAGGLMSYGPNQIEMFRHAAIYADRILMGESAANLPIQAPTKFELVFNLKVAKALGLSVPETFLVRADEVIE